MKSHQGELSSVTCRLSQEQKTELANDSLGKKLKVVIDSLPAEGVSLAEIRDLFGQDGLALLTIFLIPFSNTLPGLALLLLAIGLLQHDGLFILFGHFVNFATAIYFLILIAGGTAVIQKVMHYFM